MFPSSFFPIGHCLRLRPAISFASTGFSASLVHFPHTILWAASHPCKTVNVQSCLRPNQTVGLTDAGWQQIARASSACHLSHRHPLENFITGECQRLKLGSFARDANALPLSAALDPEGIHPRIPGNAMGLP